ncbi:type II toxin-antitoxin system VapC family toxin [Erwinia psidii]|uniref:PIN domain-containing protein n=2 Tax=Erwinia psidii TaxID=69224 RepID=A0A3N6SKF4_9GAMM|nr:type II toxin-antitoxin system VapC family toxin [Erwinia psidii]MCX8958208.1 PIN domain-containing protein [Erwinia psidii]MCX8962350.1 PIN domain-containing protein [Erwinia psidii]MCX8965134.1 PIN domain-containing protein [Erwinia psidii]RQM38116.1 PIN domain-containing protein [Erwinia psidii]
MTSKRGLCGGRTTEGEGAEVANAVCAIASLIPPFRRNLVSHQQPEAVLKRLEQAVLRNQRIVISAITYSEMRLGATSPKASPRHIQLVDAFCTRLDAILPWDRAAVDSTTGIRVALRMAGTPIGPNDTAIAGHAIAAGAILVTNNVREFERVSGLVLEDWVKRAATFRQHL